MKEAEFRFYAELNDFLSKEHQGISFKYVFNGSPAVKDSIEAVGVPHAEVDVILVNGSSVGFGYQLQDGDQVSVYPVFDGLNVAAADRLRPEPLREIRFILDVHLGTLTAKLRMLGFDTFYRNDLDDAEIVGIATDESRIILTRDRRLLMYKAVTHGYWVRSDQTEEQLAEVLKHFTLYSRVKAFHRCIACNGILQQMDKKSVIERLEPKTVLYYNEFFVCSQCNQVYWKGTHYQKMKAYVHELLKDR